MLRRRKTTSPITEAYQWDLRTALLAGFYMGSIQPFLAKIARGDLHASAFQLSLMMAAPFIGNLFSPLWAQQMEGKSKMPFAVWSWTVARGLLIFLAFVSSSWPFVLLVALSSITMTVATPAYVSIMKDIYPDTLRGRLMSYIRVFMQGMAFITALVVGRLLDLTSYQVIFPIGAVFGIAAAWTFSRIRIPRRAELPEFYIRPSIKSTLNILREDRNYRWFAFSVFVYGFGNLLVQPLYTLFQVDVLHITNTQVANMANLQSITAILGYFYWGRFLDRRGALPTVLISTLLVGMINVVYLTAGRVEHLYLAAIIAGISFSGIELSYLNATLTFADRSRIAQYQSIHSALLGVRGTIAPLLGPVLMHAVGLRGAFAVSLVMILIGAAMQYFGVRARYDDGEPAPGSPDSDEDREAAMTNAAKPQR
ncbi:MAG: MFS transporter [Armatimonadetes bacterium]|nr:MFS transporter [Armatimonadota bacterium]